MNVMRLYISLLLALTCISCGSKDSESSPMAVDVATNESNGDAINGPPDYEGIVYEAGWLISSIDGTNLNWPDSEKLNWNKVTDPSAIDHRWVEILADNAHHSHGGIDKTNLSAEISRTAQIGNYMALRGGLRYSGARKDGSLVVLVGGDVSAVIDANKNTYIGYFRDKYAR